MNTPALLSQERPFTTQQAIASGLTMYRLTALVRDHVVRRVLVGVYDWYDAPDTIERRAAAAALVVNSASVLCDRTAAWLHGVDTLAYRELDILPPLEVFVLRGRHRVARGAARGGERDLAPADVMRIGGVTVTTPLRTALDLGCRLGRRDALAALDRFMRFHGLTRDDFRAELPRYRRRRGVVQLRQLIALADARAESPGESWTRMCIIDANLPVPDLQHSIMADGRELYRLDMAYPRLRVYVEYDGEEYHSGPEQIENDETRRAWLRARGWTEIIVKRHQLTAEARAVWLGALRSALGI